MIDFGDFLGFSSADYQSMAYRPMVDKAMQERGKTIQREVIKASVTAISPMVGMFLQISDAIGFTLGLSSSMIGSVSGGVEAVLVLNGNCAGKLIVFTSFAGGLGTVDADVLGGLTFYRCIGNINKIDPMVDFSGKGAYFSIGGDLGFSIQGTINKYDNFVSVGISGGVGVSLTLLTVSLGVNISEIIYIN